MRRATVLLDGDGVIFNFVDRVLDMPLFIAPEERNKMLYHDVLASYTPTVVEHFWKYVDTLHGWVDSMPLIDGTLEALEVLRSRYHVVCVTSPHDGPYWASERLRALQRIGFHKDDIVQAANKRRVEGDILVDDHPKHCLSWSQRWQRASILRTEPGYRLPELPNDTLVTPLDAAGWPAIIRAIDEFLL